MWGPQTSRNLSISKKWFKKLHSFQSGMRACNALWEPGINFTTFEKGDEISNDLSVCFTSNRWVEEEWANDSSIRYRTPYTHFLWMKVHFLVHVRVCGWPHPIILLDVNSEMKPCLVRKENIIENTPANEFAKPMIKMWFFTGIRWFQFLKDKNGIWKFYFSCSMVDWCMRNWYLWH